MKRRPTLGEDPFATVIPDLLKRSAPSRKEREKNANAGRSRKGEKASRTPPSTPGKVTPEKTKTGGWKETLVLDEAGRAVKASTRGLAPAGTTPRPEPRARYEDTHVRATFHLSVELADGLRDAVSALSGPPLHLTLARLADSAFRRELDQLKKEHHEGKPFPRRTGELRGGRPVGS